MKYSLCDSFVLRTIAGSSILVAVGERSLKSNDVIELSESGAFLWKELEKKPVTAEELIQALTDAYEVDVQEADSDVRNYLEQLMRIGAVKADEKKI